MRKNLSVIIFLICFFPAHLTAQVGVTLNKLNPNEASNYLRPLSTWFGTYLNSGTYYSADVDNIFGFKFNIIGMWTVIPDDQKTFTPDPKDDVIGEVVPTATVFGNRNGYYLSSKGFFTYPAGLSLKAVPMGIYQLSGSLFNTELMVRLFPRSNFDEVKVGLFGFGLKHEISSHIPLLPLDISVQFLYNNFYFEYTGNKSENYTIINSSNIAFNVHASKTFVGMLIAYGGLQYESSSTDLDYYYEGSNAANKINQIQIDGDNHFRFTVGGALKLGFFVINADVNFTKFTTFTTGLSLDF